MACSLSRRRPTRRVKEGAKHQRRPQSSGRAASSTWDQIRICRAAPAGAKWPVDDGLAPHARAQAPNPTYHPSREERVMPVSADRVEAIVSAVLRRLARKEARRQERVLQRREELRARLAPHTIFFL